MNIFLCMFFKYVFNDEIIDTFSNKKVKIFFSAFPNFFFGRKMNYFGDSPFESTKLEYNSAFDSDCIITKDGRKYTIKIGGLGLCLDNDKVIGCDDNFDLWKIEKKKFGYNFKNKKKCLTFVDRNVHLRECLDLENQVFDFFEVPEILECLNEDKREEVLKDLSDDNKTKLKALGNNLKKILDEKKEPKKFDDFLSQNFDKPKDKKKKEKLKKLGKILDKPDNKSKGWGWGGFGWPSFGFLNFVCPL